MLAGAVSVWGKKGKKKGKGKKKKKSGEWARDGCRGKIKGQVPNWCGKGGGALKGGEKGKKGVGSLGRVVEGGNWFGEDSSVEEKDEGGGQCFPRKSGFRGARKGGEKKKGVIPNPMRKRGREGGKKR